jgi:peptidoglycan hydrolase-like protein with peptidoglycan-binding domain
VSKNEDVRDFQRLLNANGSSLNTDRAFGAKTKQAVINFQKQQQIVAEGIVCPKTWNKFGVRTIIF